MFIQNLESFPIIRISYSLEDAVTVHETIDIFESLLSRKEAFIFISEGAFLTQKSDHEERKQIAVWVKTNREVLTQYVKALIHVEPDERIRLDIQKFANNYVKFTGYPMFVVENKQQAQQLISSILK